MKVSRLAPIMKLKLDKMGLPGFEQNLIFLPHYQNVNDPRNTGGPRGLAGDYKVVFTLNRPGFSLLPEEEIVFEDRLEGDSHLAINKPACEPPEDSPGGIITFIIPLAGGGQFKGCPNKKGFLGKIVSDPIQAESFEDALSKAYRLLAPSLSLFSFFYDIPMNLYQADIRESRTDSLRITILQPFEETVFKEMPMTEYTEEFMKYTSFYREAMNSNSRNYQFLCFYKIIEGIRKRKNRLMAEKKEKGETIPAEPRQIIPQTEKEKIEWLKSIFPGYLNWDKMSLDQTFPNESLGRKVNDIIDKELRDIRNKIAHAVLDEEEPTISIDQTVDINSVNKWLPLTKCISRLLLKNEFFDKD